jgi:CHASE3 domain sensor protein
MKNRRVPKWLLIIATLLLLIASLFMYIENQRLNADIDQQIEEFYSK